MRRVRHRLGGDQPPARGPDGLRFAEAGEPRLVPRPADGQGFFVVPRSNSLVPGGRYEIVVPPDGIGRPIPDGDVTFLPSYDSRGRFVPDDLSFDERENHVGDAVRAIWVFEVGDPKGETYFLVTRKQLGESFPDVGKPFKLGFK